MASEENPSNITHSLSNLFGEMLMGNDGRENRSNDFNMFLSAFKEQTTRNISHEPLDFGTLVRLVDGLRNKLNLTKSPDSVCNYCEGNFRDIVLAYNNIHGYISLMVSFHV